MRYTGCWFCCWNGPATDTLTIGTATPPLVAATVLPVVAVVGRADIEEAVDPDVDANADTGITVEP